MEDPNNSKYITLEAFNPPKHCKHNSILVKIEAPCYGKHNTLEALELTDFSRCAIWENIGGSKQ